MISHPNRLVPVLMFAGWFVTAPLAGADVIQTRDGRTIEGKIVEETTGGYRIKVALGVVEIPRDRITKVVRAELEQSEFEIRWLQLGADDVAGRVALAQWARSQGLERESERAFRDVLRLQPDHEAARMALGYQRFEGRWMTPREMESVEAARAEEAAKADQLMMERTGKVLYDGQWVTPEAKANLEKGLVEYQGQWVTPEAKANLEKGLVEFEGSWMTPEEKAKRQQAATPTPQGTPAGGTPAGGAQASPEMIEEFQKLFADSKEFTSEHFLFRTNIDDAQAQAFVEDLEGAYAFMKELCRGEEPPPDALPFPVQMFRTLDQYKQSAASADEHSSAFGSFVMVQPFRIGVATMSDGPDRGRLHLFHVVGHMYGDTVFNEDTPRWFREGVSSHTERWFSEQAVAWSKSTMRKYPLQSMPDLLDSFTQVSEPNVLQAGMIVTMLRNDDNYKEVWDTLMGAALDKSDKKVERTFFKTLRKAKGLDKDAVQFVQQ